VKSITLSQMVTIIILNHVKLKSVGRLICLTRRGHEVEEVETEKAT